MSIQVILCPMFKITEILVQVFDYANHRLKSVLRFPAVDIQDAIWIDDELFVLRFEVP